MTNVPYRMPSDVEMQNFHARAHQLRAEATRDMLKAIGKSFGKAVAFVANAFGGRKAPAAN